MKNFEEIKSLFEQQIADDEKLKNGNLDILLEIAIRGDIAYRNSAYIDFIYNHAQFAVCNKGKQAHFDDDEISDMVREWAIFKLLYDFKKKDTHSDIFDFIVKVLYEEIEDTELITKTMYHIKTLTPPVYLLADFFLCELRAKAYDERCYPQATCKSVYSKLVHDLAQQNLFLAQEFISEVSKHEDMEYLNCINFVYNNEINKELENEDYLSRDDRILMTDGILKIIETYDINANTLLFSEDKTIEAIFEILSIEKNIIKTNKEIKSIINSFENSSIEVNGNLKEVIKAFEKVIDDMEYDVHIDQELKDEIIDNFNELVLCSEKEAQKKLNKLYHKCAEWKNFSKEEIDNFEGIVSIANLTSYDKKTNDKIYDIEQFIKYQKVETELIDLKKVLNYGEYTDKIKKKYNRVQDNYYGLTMCYFEYLRDLFNEVEETIAEMTENQYYSDDEDEDDEGFYDDED